MESKIRILHIDDNIHDRQLVKDALEKEHGAFEIIEADSREKFEKYISECDFDVVLSDFNILGFDGLQVLQVVKERKPDIPVIIITGTGSEEIAIQAIKMGATDYVIKSVNHIRGLAPTILMVIENKKAQDERKKNRAALRESEEKYRTIYEHANIGILLTSPDGRTFSANEFACKLFNRTEEEICRIGRFGIIDGSDPRLPVFLEERRKKRHAISELTLLRKNGSTFQAEVTSSIFLDKEGNERSSIIIRDLTKQKLSEKQLRTFESIIEQSPTSIIITDSKGKIEFVNAKFTSLLQYSLEEALGKSPRIFNAGNASQDEFDAMWKTVQSGSIWEGEFNNRKKDGTLFWENVLIFPLLDDKNLLSNYILIIEDITEKKKMIDDLVIAKENAEKADKLKTAFLHNISHEIRTPMNAILGFSNILNGQILQPEIQKHYLEIITQSCNQLLAIITDIISIASIEAGQEKVHESNTNINKVLEILYDKFIQNAQLKNIAIQIETPLSNDNAILKTDETKLIGILSNLIGNAIKFTPKGFVNFGYHLKDNNIEFYVQDSGIGVSSELHEEIFQRFRQVETNTSRQFGGSGLGLSISKAYVEMLGGKIWLTSELNKGSVFYFTIPKKPNKIENSTTTQENNQKNILSGKTILIVEDDESSFILLNELLIDYNIFILRASNGMDAVEICKKNHSIDLVLMDIKLPDLNGYEATKQILTYRPKLPIIAQSANASVNDRQKALDCGCSDFLSKPIEIRQLISKIKCQIQQLEK